MKLPDRRHFLRLATSAAALPIMSSIATAQSYPARTVRIITGFPPGGANDIYARLIAQWLSQRLGQQFIVENKPGAGGTLGTELAAKAAADGYTILLAYSGDAWNATLYTNLNFNFIRDIEPVAGIARGFGVLLVHPSVPVKSVSELIAFAKDNPGKITIASGGIGSPTHIQWELFKSLTGVDMLHVPYRGGGPALIALLGGQVQVYFATMSQSVDHIRGGTVRALGVTAATRQGVFPDLPAIGETVPGYEASFWWGLGVPRHTPLPIIDTLNREVDAALADPTMKARIAQFGDAPFPISLAEFSRLVSDDTEKWGRLIRAESIKAE
jgi:tripartite-type tricarboxylate transporter receptor subunit TctC